MKIDVNILGADCNHCKRLYCEVQKAIAELAAPASLTRVEETTEITKCQILALTVLVIDSELKSTERVPAAAEIMTWLATAYQTRVEGGLCRSIWRPQ